MKNIIYILALSLFIFNCSENDKPIVEPDLTFLEKYAGTVDL